MYIYIYIYIYALVALYDLFSSKLVKRNRFGFCLNTVKLDAATFFSEFGERLLVTVSVASLLFLQQNFSLKF